MKSGALTAMFHTPMCSPRHIQPAELRLPGVNGVLRDTHLAAHILGRPLHFQLLQRPDDLRFTVLSFRHDTPPRSAESYTLSCGLRGAGHPEGVALTIEADVPA